MDKVIKSKMQQKRGTSAEIASSTEVLLDGEIIYDTTNKKIKVGDGKTQIKNLPYLKGDGDFLPLAGGNMDEGAHIIMPGSDAGISVGSSSEGTMLLATGIQMVKNENTGMSATMSTLPDYPNAFYLNGINTDAMLLEGFEQIQLGLHNPISVSNVKDPVNNNDAANKKYVDDAVANVKPSGDYLPLSGGSMSGPIQFDTTATVASIPDMGFGIQVPNGYTGIVSQGIMHTDKAVSLDSNAVTYDIVNTQIAPGTTIKNYVCTGSGFQQMSFNGFSNVKMNSQLLLA